MTAGGQLHAWLQHAMSESGSVRSLYAQDNTLTRRGLLTRAEKRGRELAAAGVSEGKRVAICMGNVADFIVVLLAVSQLGAVAIPLDPAGGERELADLVRHVGADILIRRPTTAATPGTDADRALVVRTQRRLPGSLVVVEALDPRSDADPVPIPEGTELALVTQDPEGRPRIVCRDGAAIRDLAERSAACLEVEDGQRLLCTQSIAAPMYFDLVVLGWLASRAQLVLGDGPHLADAIAASGTQGPVTIVGSIAQIVDWQRTRGALAGPFEGRVFAPEPFVEEAIPKRLVRPLAAIGRQVLTLDELGPLATRALSAGTAPSRREPYRPVCGVRLVAGAPIEGGGRELWIGGLSPGWIWPSPPAGDPGAAVDPADDLAGPLYHTGYVGRFGRDDQLTEILGRTDGLVELDGRRASLDAIERQMLSHRRLTWARATARGPGEGERYVHLEYQATGETPVDDLEEHAVATLPPYMVPRAFERSQDG